MEKVNTEAKSNLCRICLGLGEYDIFSGVIVVDDKNIQIDAMLKEFTSLDLENLDLDSSHIPTLICNLCSDKLIECYQFLQQIQQADDYIMNLLTMPPYTFSSNEDYHDNKLFCKNASRSDSENEKHPEIEEYTVQILNDFDNEIIEKNPSTIAKNHNTEISKNLTKVQRKRKINNSKKLNLVLTENVSNIPHFEHDPVNCDINSDDDNVGENVINKKLKISNIHKSVDDVAFVITKFIPSETITTTHTNVNIDESAISNQTDSLTYNNQYNNDDIVKSNNIIRTYDLAAVEIDPTDKKQFEKLMGINYDDDNDDEDNNDDNSDSSCGAVYACQYCTRAFSSSQFLKQHIRKTHVCQFCMKGFPKSAQLFEHIRNNHSQFNCPFCQKSYKSNSNLRQHMKKIHTFKLPAHTSLLAFSKKDENVLSSNQSNTVIG